MEPDKPKFWHTPHGRVMSHMVHEAVGGTSIVGGYLHLWEKGEPISAEDVQTMKRALKRANEAVDYGYEEIKKLQGYGK